MIADLHIHTTASDGKLTPAHTVAWAKNRGIEVMSVTDHDSVDGLDEAEAEAKRQGIRFVRGIELSSFLDCEIHVLGYNMQTENPCFIRELSEVKNMRKARNVEIGRKLTKSGINLDMDFEAEGIGRMNIARRLAECGYVKDTSEAFDRYLGLGGLAYCTPKRITPKQAVELITKYGGFASLAHPKKYLADGRLKKLLDELVPCGLKGIEVYYPGHFDSDKEALRKECKRYGLLPTGGSDFHGDEDKKLDYKLDFRLIEAMRIN